MRPHRYAESRYVIGLFGNGLTVTGDPGRKLRPYAETHWRMSELVKLYGLPKHKLTDLLPPPDVVLNCYRATRLWSRQRVIDVLGVPV